MKNKFQMLSFPSLGFYSKAKGDCIFFQLTGVLTYSNKLNLSV